LKNAIDAPHNGAERTVNQINEFIEIKVSLWCAHPSPEQRAVVLFPLSGICAAGDGRGRIYLGAARIKEWVKEKERQGQGKSKRVRRLCARGAHICIAPFVTCIIHVHQPGTKTNSIPHTAAV
jgi:hypothetical protein